MRPPALPPSLPRSAKARRALVRLIDRLDRQRCCGRGCEWTEPHGVSEGGGHSCGGETILEVALRVGCLLSCCPTIADRQERESRRRDSTAVYWIPQPCDDSLDTRPRLQTPTRTRAGRGVHLLRSHDRFSPSYRFFSLASGAADPTPVKQRSETTGCPLARAKTRGSSSFAKAGQKGGG